MSCVTRITLLTKHSHVNLQFKLKYLCPCVTCGYPCYSFTQTLSRKFAILVEVFVSLCHLQLPVLSFYPNTVQCVCNLRGGICAPCVTCRNTCYPVNQNSQVNLLFKWMYFLSLCYLRLLVLPCYPNTVQSISNLS